jgi:uncharacterized membrane protein (DUF4010 family)
MNAWQPYLISIVIGMLVGIERERSHPHQKALGVRTFLLISLLGAIAGGLESPIFAAILAVFAFGLILISYFNQTRRSTPHSDPGMTTEFAAGVVFCLGYVAHLNPTLAALAGPLVAVILFSKTSFHRFTRALEPGELKAALLLLLGGVVVVNILPEFAVDPWGMIIPKRLGYLVLTLAAIEFSSYVLVKIIGEKRGLLIVGFLGGLVSSTAVLLSSSRQSVKVPTAWRGLVCSVLASQLAAFAELLAIVVVVAPSVFQRVAPAVGAGFLLGAIFLVFMTRALDTEKSNIVLKSPLDWQGVFRLSVVLAVVLTSISLTKIWLGERAALAVSFLTGLFELHGVAFANATMFTQGNLSINSAGLAIVSAIIASLIAKVSICWAVGRGDLARVVTGVFMSLSVVIGIVYWLI